MLKKCPQCEISFECNNANRVFCNAYCQGKHKRLNKVKNAKCPACDKESEEWGKEYNYLCKNCELLAFKVDYEEEITEERYL